MTAEIIRKVMVKGKEEESKEPVGRGDWVTVETKDGDRHILGLEDGFIVKDSGQMLVSLLTLGLFGKGDLFNPGEVYDFDDLEGKRVKVIGKVANPS